MAAVVVVMLLLLVVCVPGCGMRSVVSGVWCVVWCGVVSFGGCASLWGFPVACVLKGLGGCQEGVWLCRGVCGVCMGWVGRGKGMGVVRVVAGRLQGCS
jgi:hypothetical protein